MKSGRLKKIILISSLGILIAGIAYFYFSFNPSVFTDYFPKCPSRTIFNVYCPGCGSQRAFHQLLHGGIAAAFRYNPLMIILLPLIAALVVQFVLRHFLNVYWKLPLVNNNIFLWTILVVFIVYFILRNIDIAALDFLKPPK